MGEAMTTDTNDNTTDVWADMHRAELAAAPDAIVKVRYAKQVLGPDATRPQVKQWLIEQGHEVSRSTFYEAWKKAENAPMPMPEPRSVTDTADLPKLTDEQLAALDAAIALAAPATATEPDPEPEDDEAAAAQLLEVDQADIDPEPSGAEVRDVPVAEDRTPAVEPEPIPAETPDEIPAESGIPAGPDIVAGVTGFRPDMTEMERRMIAGIPRPIFPKSAYSTPEPDSIPAAPAPRPVVAEQSGRTPEPSPESGEAKRSLAVWPVLLMALSAFVSIWSGWVGLGEMTGFGVVQPFPGISDFQLNTAITLPIGVEAYASYALYVWLSGRTGTESTRLFAKWSAFGALALGAAGQIAYHLLTQSQAKDMEKRQAAADAAAKAAGRTAEVVHATAPWWITTFVACLPVVVVGMGAALAHMVRRDRE